MQKSTIWRGQCHAFHADAASEVRAGSGKKQLIQSLSNMLNGKKQVVRRPLLT
jgi:hypothetical protein